MVDRHPLHIYKNDGPPLNISLLKGDRLLGGYSGNNFYIAHMTDKGHLILSRFNVHNGGYEKSWYNCIILVDERIALNEAYQLVSNGEGRWYLGKVSEMLGYISYPDATTDWLAPYFGSNNETKKLNIFWNKKAVPHAHKNCPHIGITHFGNEDSLYDVLGMSAGVLIVFGSVMGVAAVPCFLKVYISGNQRVSYAQIGREHCPREVREAGDGTSSERECSSSEEVRGAGDSALWLEMRRIDTQTS